jgi:predicted naringenin-chalcone synthase
MPVSFIHQIETTVPEHVYRQDEVRERMKQIIQGNERDGRIIHQLYARSGIETRYSVVDDFYKGGSNSLFFNGQGTSPGTKSRNETYIREGRKLFVKTAGKLMESSTFCPPDITHLITVSCTGFYAPGPDYDIIQSLGLKPSVERYHLGFMGCYASIPALKMADQICRATPDAVVMVVSVELCTLHFQASPKLDNLLSASVFADGGAGAIVSSKKPEKQAFRMDGFASSITENGANDMAWSIGDQGFSMVLSTYIPKLLSEGLELFLEPVLTPLSLRPGQIDLWAVHPGGRAILDKVQNTLSLSDELLSASRRILSKYGNMSSATILFVLKELMDKPQPKPKNHTLAMAFGPGLTLEAAVLSLG